MKIFIVLIFSTIYMYATIFYINSEKSLNRLIKDLNSTKYIEDTIILDKINLTHKLIFNKQKKTYFINVLNTKGELISVDFIENIIKKINNLFFNKEKKKIIKDVKINKNFI